MLKLVLAVLLALGLNACSDRPLWESARYTVTGTFNADGSCRALLDGSPTGIQHDPLHGSTEYWREFAYNVDMGPSQDLQVVSCGDLSISFRWHKRELLQVGRYPIAEGGELPMPAIGSATGFASHWYVGKGPLFRPKVSLHSVTGKVTLDHVDTALVVGDFEFIARGRSGM